MNDDRCATTIRPMTDENPENDVTITSTSTRPLRLQRIPDAGAHSQWSSFASTVSNVSSTPSSTFARCKTPAPMLSSFAGWSGSGGRGSEWWTSPWGGSGGTTSSGMSGNGTSGNGGIGRRKKAVMLGSLSHSGAVPPKHRRVFDYSSFPHPHPYLYTTDPTTTIDSEDVQDDKDNKDDKDKDTLSTLNYSYPPLTPPRRPTLSANAISPLTSNSYSFLLEHRDGELSGYSYTPPEFYINRDAFDTIPFASLFPTPPPHPSIFDSESSPYISPIQHHPQQGYGFRQQHYSPLVRVDLRSPEKKYTEQKKRVSVRLIVNKLKKQAQQQVQAQTSSPASSSSLASRSGTVPPAPPLRVSKRNAAKRRRLEEEEGLKAKELEDEDASGESDPEQEYEHVVTPPPHPPPNEREKRLLRRRVMREEDAKEREGEEDDGDSSSSSSSASPFVLTGRTIYSLASSDTTPSITTTNATKGDKSRMSGRIRSPSKRAHEDTDERKHSTTSGNSNKRIKIIVKKENSSMNMSPLTPLTPTPSRPFASATAPAPIPATQPSSSSRASQEENSEPLPVREFPPVVEEIRPDVYERFYRRFWISSFAIPGKETMKPPPSATANAARSYFDLYTPRFTKGRGPSKLGLCPICIEPKERGGEGRAFWGAMKVSAYNYHMQYYHGISPQSYLPFSPPLSFRATMIPNPAKMEKKEITEGQCHKCEKWVAVDGVKDVEVKVKELFWWKHAAMCHRGSRVEDEGGWERYVDEGHQIGSGVGSRRARGRGRGVWVEDELWEEACRLVALEDVDAVGNEEATGGAGNIVVDGAGTATTTTTTTTESTNVTVMTTTTQSQPQLQLEPLIPIPASSTGEPEPMPNLDMQVQALVDVTASTNEQQLEPGT